MVEIFAPKLAKCGTHRKYLTKAFNRLRESTSLEEYIWRHVSCNRTILKYTECLYAIDSVPPSSFSDPKICFMIVYEYDILFVGPFPTRCLPLNKEELRKRFHSTEDCGKLLNINVGFMEKNVRIAKY
jgi:hypothetical protein